MNTVATTQAACIAWNKDCRWNGVTGCEDRKPDCASISVSSLSSDTLKKSFCSSYTPADGKSCTFKDNKCADLVCSNAVGMTSQSDCDNYLSGCYWDGSSCQAKVSTCDSIIIPATAAANQQAACNGAVLLTTSQKCEKHSSDTTKC